MAVSDILGFTLIEEAQKGATVLINAALEDLDRLAALTGKITPPDNALFSWVTQGSATVTGTAAGLFLKDPGHTGAGLKIRKMAAPATPYTLTACLVSANQRITSNVKHGLCFRQSSDGKLHALQCGVSNAGSFGVQSTKYTSDTSAQTDYTDGAYSAGAAPLWLRIADDGTDRIGSVSGDGLNWLEWHRIGRTDYLTANEIGFFVDADSAITKDHAVTLVSWLIA